MPEWSRPSEKCGGASPASLVLDFRAVLEHEVEERRRGGTETGFFGQALGIAQSLKEALRLAPKGFFTAQPQIFNLD